MAELSSTTSLHGCEKIRHGRANAIYCRRERASKWVSRDSPDPPIASRSNYWPIGTTIMLLPLALTGTVCRDRTSCSDPRLVNFKPGCERP